MGLQSLCKSSSVYFFQQGLNLCWGVEEGLRRYVNITSQLVHIKEMQACRVYSFHLIAHLHKITWSEDVCIKFAFRLNSPFCALAVKIKNTNIPLYTRPYRYLVGVCYFSNAFHQVMEFCFHLFLQNTVRMCTHARRIYILMITILTVIGTRTKVWENSKK